MDEPGSLATAPPPTHDATAPPGPVHAAVPGEAQAVEEQLRRLETRLVAEADGDPAAQREARRLMALSRDRFRAATIRTFLPILIERDVRRRLSGG